MVAEWIAYNQLEPIGEERADLRAGIIASTVANVHRGKRKAFKASDFMPKFEQNQGGVTQSLASMKAMMQRFGNYVRQAAEKNK